MDSESIGLPDHRCAGALSPPHAADEPAHATTRIKPHQAPPFIASKIIRIDCNDADELAELVSDWSLQLTHLRPGPFTASARLIPLGSVLICRAHYSKSMGERTAPPEGCLSFGRPGRASGPVNHLGHALEDGQVFVCGPGGDNETVGLGARYSNTLSIRCDVLEQESDWLAHFSLPTPASSMRVHEPGVAWTTGYLEAMDWIFDAVERYPEATSRADVRGSLVDSLLARVNLLGATKAPIHADRQMRTHRRLAVERAREYIARNLAEPIRLSDLSRHAHTQARSLEYGFREVLGVSPMTYVRAARMHRARHMLRTTAVRTRSISEIALDCGFWHLSQFAVDYKQLFAESPSVTYRRTEAQLPRSERRRAVSMKLPVHAATTWQ